VAGLVSDGEAPALLAVRSAGADDQAVAVVVDAAGFVLVGDGDLGDAAVRGEHPHVDRDGGAGLGEEAAAESADDGFGVGAAVPAEKRVDDAVGVARHVQVSSSRVRLIRMAS